MRPGPILLFIAVAYLLFAIGLYIVQRRLIYSPSTDYLAPEDMGLAGVEEIIVKTKFTRRLLAWYAPARQGRPTILYFHGNGGSLATRVGRLDFFRQQGFGILMTTYRGYSGSSDSPAEFPIKMDALYFYHWLQARGVKERNIIIYGESLGTGIAVATALNHHPGAVILEAPYSSVVDVGAARFPWLPVRWFMKDRYESDRLIGQITAPVFIVHGELDKVIPIRFAKKLFEAASQPKEAVWLRDAAHNDLYSKGAFDLISRFIERHL
jgi:fermentation-respiration switch protein FrsA (DUF1100 family)